MKTIKYYLILVIFTLNLSIAQNIIIEAVQLTETVDNKYLSKIPMLVDLDNNENKSVAKINRFILDRFMIDGFEQEELTEFRWYELDFQSEIKENIAYISFTGEYYGAYLNYIEEELFFNLSTGEELINNDIPFQALFELDTYLEYINEYWLDSANKAFTEAIECAGLEPYCSVYDINYKYQNEEQRLKLDLDSFCYARANLACTPEIDTEIFIDKSNPYLSSFGQQVFADNYFSKTGVDKYLYNQKTKNEIPNNFYIFGKIDAKYPFSMAINLDRASAKVSGFYYYDNNQLHEKILLIGEYRDVLITMQESVNSKITGNFKFKWAKEYGSASFPYLVSYLNGNSLYISGSWSNPDKSEVFDIEITEIKTNNNY